MFQSLGLQLYICARAYVCACVRAYVCARVRAYVCVRVRVRVCLRLSLSDGNGSKQQC